jgi:hypothetical protein
MIAMKKSPAGRHHLCLTVVVQGFRPAVSGRPEDLPDFRPMSSRS